MVTWCRPLIRSISSSVTIRHRNAALRALMEQVNLARPLRVGEGMAGKVGIGKLALYGREYLVAVQPREKGLIWVGTNDGLVQLTRDGGRTWTNLSRNIPGMPARGTVSNTEPSKYDVGTAYLTVDAHQENNRDPWVYRTTDFGRTSITSWAETRYDGMFTLMPFTVK